MSKRTVAVLVITLLFAFAITTLAHSGRTDSRGGHWDRRDGEYHYHHGYPAHDHYDIDGDGKKDCTILYEKNNLANSQKISNWIETAVWIVIFFIILVLVFSLFWRLNPDEANAGCGCLTTYFIVVVLANLFKSYPLYVLVIVVFVAILWFLSYRVYKLYKKTDCKGRIDKYERTVNEYISCLEKYETKVNEYLFFSRTPIPVDCEIKCGLPAEKGVTIGWGEKFTVYQSTKGNKIHTVCGCCSANEEKHIYTFYRNRTWYDLRCKKCALYYSPPDMEWYENYLQYIELLREIIDLYDKNNELKDEVLKHSKDCNKFLIKFIVLFNRQCGKCLKETNELVCSLQTLKTLKENKEKTS